MIKKNIIRKICPGILVGYLMIQKTRMKTIMIRIGDKYNKK